MGILICGLNGVGKSTIGKKLAERLSYCFIDNEDLYFPKDDKSYMFSNPRSKDEVIHLLEEKIETDDKFVFAAVKGDYGDKLLTKLDYIILVEVPKETRMERVKERSLKSLVIEYLITEIFPIQKTHGLRRLIADPRTLSHHGWKELNAL